MDEVLTMEEIEARFPEEWILIDQPEKDQHGNVASGRVVFHSPDRDEIGRKALELPFHADRLPLHEEVQARRGLHPMTFPFDPNLGAIVVVGELDGPAGTADLRLLVDTGANVSVIVRSTERPVMTRSTARAHPSTTASSAEKSVGFFRVSRLTALT